jgi:hypothetical protein
MAAASGTQDVADLCIALAELQTDRAHRAVAPPAPPASLEALAAALGRSLDAPAALPELGFCTVSSISATPTLDTPA